MGRVRRAALAMVLMLCACQSDSQASSPAAGLDADETVSVDTSLNDQSGTEAAADIVLEDAEQLVEVETTEEPVYRLTQEDIDEALEMVMENYSATAVAVIEDGQVTQSGAWGWAVKDKREMTADTKMWAASLTKVAVGMCAMAMYEDGVVDLDAPLSDYWGSGAVNPYSKAQPSSRTLMSHSSSLKALDSDLIAVMLHWGNEYKDNPNSHQTNLAQFLVEQGADTIIGGHPHVLEPYETISVTGWDGQEREGFVCYSLGNFISGQKDLETRTTVVLDLELTKDPVTGETTITDVGYVPYYMSYRKNAAVGERYQLLDIHEAMAEYEAGESTVVDKTIYGLLKESLAHCYDVMGSEGDQKAQADQ